ncbi:Hypothetical predicted protein [Octopus vulgaris]|uniref:DUF7041 domain-containing protein n=1 Tax=Octopus vulgaris TaxID=6645 RepID=A0AA36F713_OCTVU|nr:Hypothetical predicted protein [Octopus vulgaris]
MQASTTVLPPAWMGDSIIWFAQLEARFAANRITTEAQKSPPLSNEIRDLLIDPTKSFVYSTIKEEILKTTSNSQQKEFAKLFNNEQLGNRKPTQLLRRMKEILRNQQIEESYLKEVFFVDTGAACSIWPAKLLKEKLEPAYLTLQVVNQSDIQTFEEISLTLDLHLRREYKWVSL